MGAYWPGGSVRCTVSLSTSHPTVSPTSSLASSQLGQRPPWSKGLPIFSFGRGVFKGGGDLATSNLGSKQQGFQ